MPGNDADLREVGVLPIITLHSGKQETGVQLMKLTQIGRNVYGKNTGGTWRHRHAVRLHIHGYWVTCTWRNTVRGAMHHGVPQLRIAANGRSREGGWLGLDADVAIQDEDWK